MKKFYILLIALFIVNGAHSQGWQWLNPLPTGNHLWSVDFIDAATGYTVDNNGTILKTSDGGITWTSQYLGSSKSLHSVFL